MVTRTQLIDYLDTLLGSARIRDYAPNGLQVEGRGEVRRLVTGVSACQALVDEAVRRGADALLVHHGYFWKGESPELVGVKRRRVAALMVAEVNLIAYHLPLDIHPELGNNAQLAQVFELEVEGQVAVGGQEGLLWWGRTRNAYSAEGFAAHVAARLERTPTLITAGKRGVQRVAWCSGGAEGYLPQAAELGVDLYLSGELSEPVVHLARELGVHYLAAGHHATERYGVRALGDHLAERFDLEHHFVEIANPA